MIQIGKIFAGRYRESRFQSTNLKQLQLLLKSRWIIKMSNQSLS